MYAGKPIIGLVGGIGSGKSFVAKLFAEAGCLVIDSDAQVREVYRDPDVLQTIQQWWGEQVLHENGTLNRSFVAAKVFADPKERERLERLIHPRVNTMREHQMLAAADDAQVKAYVWDTPLLLEAGLGSQCDTIVFVDAPDELRARRARDRSGWDRQEWLTREKSQMPLDTKRSLSDYVLANTADAESGPLALADLREQVQRVLSQILTRVKPIG
jgi:dephospho-CoA kinase